MRGTSGIAGALLALLALVWVAHGLPSGQTRVVDAPEREAPVGSARPAAPSTASASPTVVAPPALPVPGLAAAASLAPPPRLDVPAPLPSPGADPQALARSHRHALEQARRAHARRLGRDAPEPPRLAPRPQIAVPVAPSPQPSPTQRAAAAEAELFTHLAEYRREARLDDALRTYAHAARQLAAAVMSGDLRARNRLRAAGATVLAAAERERPRGALGERVRTLRTLLETDRLDAAVTFVALAPRSPARPPGPSLAPRDAQANAVRAPALLEVIPPDAPPSADDLALDRPDEPALDAVVAAHARDPLSLFRHVHDRVAPDLYRGARLAPRGVLDEGRANDLDAALCLVDLLRRAEVPARLELARVVLTPTMALSLTGTRDLEWAVRAMRSAGLEAERVVAAGVDVGVRTTHWFVRAWLATNNAPGQSEAAWIHLAPLLKPVALSENGAEFVSLPPLTDDLLYGLEAPSALFSAAGAPLSVTRTWPVWADRFLPQAPPVVKLASLGMVRAAPVSERWAVRLRLDGAPILTTDTAALYGERLGVDTVAADPASRALLDAAGGDLERAPVADLALALRFTRNDAVMGDSAPGPAGRAATLTVEVEHPAFGPTARTFDVRRGVRGALVLAAGRPNGTHTAADRNAALGLRYFDALEAASTRILDAYGAEAVREPRVALVTLEPRVTDLGGLPISLTRDAVVLDVPGIVLTPYARAGDAGRLVDALRLLGHESSHLEGRIPGEFYAGDGYSAQRVLATARAQGQRVFDVVDIELRHLLVSEQIAPPADLAREMYRLAYDDDWRVRVPERPVPAGDGAGQVALAAFVGFDPRTGAGAYLIEPALNGGYFLLARPMGGAGADGGVLQAWVDVSRAPALGPESASQAGGRLHLSLRAPRAGACVPQAEGAAAGAHGRPPAPSPTGHRCRFEAPAEPEAPVDFTWGATCRPCAAGAAVGCALDPDGGPANPCEVDPLGADKVVAVLLNGRPVFKAELPLARLFAAPDLNALVAQLPGADGLLPELRFPGQLGALTNFDRAGAETLRFDWVFEAHPSLPEEGAWSVVVAPAATPSAEACAVVQQADGAWRITRRVNDGAPPNRTFGPFLEDDRGAESVAPIDTDSGQLRLTVPTRLRGPYPGGEVEFEARYASFDVDLDGDLGPGFRHTWDGRVSVGDGDAVTLHRGTAASVTWRRVRAARFENGRAVPLPNADLLCGQRPFDADGHCWVPDRSDERGLLERRVAARLTSAEVPGCVPAWAGFVYHATDGVRFFFEHDRARAWGSRASTPVGSARGPVEARLTRVRDPFDNGVDLARDPQTGRLEEVRTRVAGAPGHHRMSLEYETFRVDRGPAGLSFEAERLRRVQLAALAAPWTAPPDDPCLGTPAPGADGEGTILAEARFDYDAGRLTAVHDRVTLDATPERSTRFEWGVVAGRSVLVGRVDPDGTRERFDVVREVTARPAPAPEAGPPPADAIAPALGEMAAECDDLVEAADWCANAQIACLRGKAIAGVDDEALARPRLIYTGWTRADGTRRTYAHGVRGLGPGARPDVACQDWPAVGASVRVTQVDDARVEVPETFVHGPDGRLLEHAWGGPDAETTALCRLSGIDVPARVYRNATLIAQAALCVGDPGEAAEPVCAEALAEAEPNADRVLVETWRGLPGDRPLVGERGAAGGRERRTYLSRPETVGHGPIVWWERASQWVVPLDAAALEGEGAPVRAVERSALGQEATVRGAVVDRVEGPGDVATQVAVRSAAGQPMQVEGADGTTEVRSRDPVTGAATMVVDAEGELWTYEVDLLGRTRVERTPGGAPRTTTYGPDPTYLGLRVRTVVTPAQGRGEAFLVEQAFDPAGRLRRDAPGLAASDPGGAQGEATPDASRIEVYRRFDYDGQTGRLQRVLEADLGTSLPACTLERRDRETRFEYDARGRLAAEVDVDAQTALRPTYDLRGREVAWTLRAVDRFGEGEGPERAVSAQSYDALGRVVTQADEGYVRRWVWDRAGEVAETAPVDPSAPAEDVETTTRDVLGRVVRVTTARGPETRFTHDRSDRVVQRVESLGGGDEVAEQVDYGAPGQAPGSDRPARHRTWRGGELHTDAQWTYGGAGARPSSHSLETRVPALGPVPARVTRLAVDWRWRVDGVERTATGVGSDGEALSPTTEVELHDGLGRVVETRTGAVLRRFTYDGLGRVVRSAHGSGFLPSAQVLDLEGRAVVHSGPDGKWYGSDHRHARLSSTGECRDAALVTDVYANVLGEPEVVCAPAPPEVPSPLDAAGPADASACRDPALSQTSRVRAALGLDGAAQLSSTDPLGRTYETTVDALGLSRVATRPGRGTERVEQVAFDPVGRVLRATRRGPIGGPGESTAMRWDAAGRMLESQQVDAPWASFTHVFQGLRQVTARVSDPTDSWTRLVEPEGTPWAAVRGGEVERWDYDALGRLTRRVSATGEVEAWRYDGSGRVVEATTSGGTTRTTEFLLDTDAQTLRVLPHGEVERTAWSFSGRPTSVQVDGVRLQSLEYDDAVPGEATVTVSRGVESETRTVTRGWLSRVARGAQVTELGYAPDGRLEAGLTRGADAASALRRDLRRDDAGRPVETLHNGRRVRRVEYDALDRPTRVFDARDSGFALEWRGATPWLDARRTTPAGGGGLRSVTYGEPDLRGRGTRTTRTWADGTQQVETHTWHTSDRLQGTSVDGAVVSNTRLSAGGRVEGADLVDGAGYTVLDFEPGTQRPTHVRYGGGLEATLTWLPDGRPDTAVYAAPNAAPIAACHAWHPDRTLRYVRWLEAPECPDAGDSEVEADPCAGAVGAWVRDELDAPGRPARIRQCADTRARTEHLRWDDVGRLRAYTVESEGAPDDGVTVWLSYDGPGGEVSRILSARRAGVEGRSTPPPLDPPLALDRISDVRTEYDALGRPVARFDTLVAGSRAELRPDADGRATTFGNVTLNRDATGAPEVNGARFDEHGQRVVDGQGPLRWDESGLRSVSRNGRRRQHGPLLHGVQAVWLTGFDGRARPELRLTAPTLSPLVWFDPAQGSVARTALHTPTGDVDETPDWTVRSRSIDEDPTTTYGYQRFRSTPNGGAWLNDAGARRFLPGAGMYLEPDPILPADEDVLPGLWLHARGDLYHVVDPDGRCGLVGAAVGGALGAALSGAFALYNGDDPATALARAVVGGVGGSVLGATCGLAASAGAGGVVGAFQGGVNTALDSRGAPLTLAELGRGALVGGVGGALAGVAGGYLGGRTDLNAFARVTLNTYADLGADLLAQGAGTALGGGPLDLERAVFAAAFGTGVRAVHLGGASAHAALRSRAGAAPEPSEISRASGTLRLHRHPRGAILIPVFGKKVGARPETRGIGASAVDGGPSRYGDVVESADTLLIIDARHPLLRSSPKHHIFPQANRQWFAVRGVDIDMYTIKISEGDHSAIHFGGGPGMGGGWWNEQIMRRLTQREAALGRQLTPREIRFEGAQLRRRAGLQHVKVEPY